LGRREKIVQVGIDLPPLSPNALTEVLFRGINEALELSVNEHEFTMTEIDLRSVKRIAGFEATSIHPSAQ
jgi:hypothetical protein